MRRFLIAIACVISGAVTGCESPPPAMPPEFAEQAPAPPEPAAPAEPAPVVTPEVEAAQAAASAPAAEGNAAIAKARETLMKQAGAAGEAAPAAEPAPAEPAPAEGAPPEAATPEAAPQEPPAPDGAAAEPPAEGEELAKAEAGVGAKGRDYGGPGFVTTPIETMFRVEDRLAFEVKVPEAMKLYKAEHNNKGPKSHAEFMKVIIQANQIQLPELPAGNAYWYDAKTEELMVRSPKPKA